MTSALDDFIADARAVTIEEAATRLGLKFTGKRNDHPQPCPACGGTDRFSFNTAKNAWSCRGAGGGRDAIGMAAHVEDLNLKMRSGFLAACEAVTGREAPAHEDRESDADRAARKARLEQRRLEAYEAMAAREADAVDWRERERARARGIYDAAAPIAGTAAALYVEKRGCGVPDGRALRFSAGQPYWHGEDERGRPAVLFTGPAMVAPFIGPDLAVIGCHITWIDIRNPPKYWPSIVDPATGELLPSKKMRGSKKGGLIPLAGRVSARRWAGGEGIENGLAFAGWEGFRDDTFYFAAGDLGNLTGPAGSRFAHPTLKRPPDARGIVRPVMVAGADPKPDQSPDDALWIGDHVDELVFLGDGDSEPVMTIAAMARARARAARPGRSTFLVWPPAGRDFAALAFEAAS